RGLEATKPAFTTQAAFAAAKQAALDAMEPFLRVGGGGGGDTGEEGKQEQVRD
ncbi:hypothetical protein JCM10213_006862, partial [Rhodosporidiobolus nylandii]